MLLYYVSLFAVGGISAVLVIIKIYVKLHTGIYRGKERLDGKTIVITGANAGIGFEVAKDLANRGARIVMVCRNMEKAEKCKKKIINFTANRDITIKHIDLASLESVRKCAKEIVSEVERIDILVNNAAEGLMGVRLTDDGLENVMQTNHYGPFLFTHILLGKILMSAPSRIINVTSYAYTMKELDFDLIKNFKCEDFKDTMYNQILLYAFSKLANVYFTRILAEKLKDKGVTVNCVHPGAVYTEFVKRRGLMKNLIYSLLAYPTYKSCEEGAQPIIHLCCSPDVADVTGEYFAECKREELKPIGKDYGAAKKMWEISEELVKLRSDEILYN